MARHLAAILMDPKVWGDPKLHDRRPVPNGRRGFEGRKSEPSVKTVTANYSRTVTERGMVTINASEQLDAVQQTDIPVPTTPVRYAKPSRTTLRALDGLVSRPAGKEAELT